MKIAARVLDLGLIRFLGPSGPNVVSGGPNVVSGS